MIRKRRYSLFSLCKCGRTVHIVMKRYCCDIDHLNTALVQDHEESKEWGYFLDKIQRLTKRLDKEKIKLLKQQQLEEKRKSKVKREIKSEIVVADNGVVEKQKIKIAYTDSMGKVRMKSSVTKWRKKLNEKLREAVLTRDNKQCVKCSATDKLHVHHKLPRSKGGKDEISNLETLCDLCHAEEHRGEPIYNIMVRSLFSYQ